MQRARARRYVPMDVTSPGEGGGGDFLAFSAFPRFACLGRGLGRGLSIDTLPYLALKTL